MSAPKPRVPGRSRADARALASVAELAELLGRRRSLPSTKSTADRRASAALYDALHKIGRAVGAYDTLRARGVDCELVLSGVRL